MPQILRPVGAAELLRHRDVCSWHVLSKCTARPPNTLQGRTSGLLRLGSGGCVTRTMSQIPRPVGAAELFGVWAGGSCVLLLSAQKVGAGGNSVAD